MREILQGAILAVLLGLHPSVGPVAILAHKAAAAGCNLSSAAYTDSFPGSSLNATYWTTNTAGAFTSTVTVSSGKAIPVASGGIAFAVLTGCTTPVSQTAQFSTANFYAPSQGHDTGPIVRASTSGNFYQWSASDQTVNKFASGSYSSSISVTCPTVTTGDVIALSASGTSTTTLTCKDITSSSSASGTDTSSPYTSGYTGFVVDQLSSTNAAVESFEATTP